MTVAEALAAIRAALEVRKVIEDRLNRPEVDTVDIRSKVHEMLIHLSNTQVGLNEAQVEISELRRRIADLENDKALAADLEMVPVSQYYVRRSEKEAGSFVPYCPTCWGAEGKRVALAPGVEQGTFRCAIHRTLYYTEDYRRQQANRDEERRHDSNAFRVIPRGPDSWMAR